MMIRDRSVRRSIAPFCHLASGLAGALLLLGIPVDATASAMGKLRPGETVEVSGEWHRNEGVFVATKIEKLRERRDPSARGAIEALDPRAATFRLFGREVRVHEATAFPADSGAGRGRIADLRPGMRVEVSADPEPGGAWEAKRVVWREVKASDKVKGQITEVAAEADSAQIIWISGLVIRVTGETELVTDYLEEELLGTLFSDEGDANVPHLRLGPLQLAGYGRMTTHRDNGYTLSGADDDSLIGQPAIALQVAGDWSRWFQTMVDMRLSSDQSFPGRRFDVTNARLELLQGYAVLRAGGAKGIMVMAGKQRVRDQREWLFDEYLDAVRLYLTVARPLVLEASYLPSVLPPAGESFATWDDLLFRARLIPNARNEANVYWMKRRDSSPRNREPLYLGLSYTGRPARWLRGWLEAALLRGEDKGRPQRAHALDVGTTFSTTGRIRPSVTFAYAVGSGEEKVTGDPYSQEFRQTGYEDNSGRYGGFSSFKYYGEVLDPELANLEVLTAGAGIRFGYAASADVVVHVYRQPVPDDAMRASLPLEDVAPDGDSRDLGREVDFIFGVQNIVGRASLGYGFGLFTPGKALNVTDVVASRHRVSVRFDF